jgi:glutathione-specific gamma-glutamylcyclotransferase
MTTQGNATDLWLFAYGSVIWAPDFPFKERRRARLPGYIRWFSQASNDHRGTLDKPGIVANILEDANAECWGLVYQVAQRDAKPVLSRLDIREKAGYQRRHVLVEAEGSDSMMPIANTVVYIAPPDNPYFKGRLSPIDIADIAAERQGPSGTNAAYVHSLAEALRDLDIIDNHILEVVRALDERSA